VDFLFDLGVPKHDIPRIIQRSPQLCGISLTQNLKPRMLYLESLGVDKTKWAKIITRYPLLFPISRQKIKSVVDFLLELGVPEENVGKTLTQWPNLLSFSVEVEVEVDVEEVKLQPASEYFSSLGVNVPFLIQKYPQNFGLSIEAKLKPTTVFFEEKGFSIEEIGTMVNKFRSLYMYNLGDNLVPKWEYFLTLGYCKRS
jgi:mTERF domain-containing protein, mitochondrial